MSQEISFFRNVAGRVCMRMKQFSPDVYGEPKLTTDVTHPLSLNAQGEIDDPKTLMHPKAFMQFLKADKAKPVEEVKIEAPIEEEHPVKKSFFGKKK